MSVMVKSFLVLVGVAFVVGYDFQDSVYNEILARDLEELSLDSGFPSHRSRRDEDAQKEDKCRRKHWKGCCADETFEELHDKDRMMKRECFKQVTGKDRDSKYFPRDPFKCDNVEKHRKDMTCVMQCVLQKKNILDGEGNIKDESFKNLLKDAVKKEAWLTPMIDKIASKCLEDARNATALTTPSPTTTPGGASDTESAPCNPAGIKLGRCIFKEIQMSCPGDQIKDEKACSRIRDRIRRNEDFLPHPQPQMDDDN